MSHRGGAHLLLQSVVNATYRPPKIHTLPCSAIVGHPNNAASDPEGNYRHTRNISGDNNIDLGKKKIRYYENHRIKQRFIRVSKGEPFISRSTPPFPQRGTSVCILKCFSFSFFSRGLKTSGAFVRDLNAKLSHPCWRDSTL